MEHVLSFLACDCVAPCIAIFGDHIDAASTTIVHPDERHMESDLEAPATVSQITVKMNGLIKKMKIRSFQR